MLGLQIILCVMIVFAILCTIIDNIDLFKFKVKLSDLVKVQTALFHRLGWLAVIYGIIVIVEALYALLNRQ